MLFSRFKDRLPTPTEALRGRSLSIPTADRHFVNGHALKPPYPQGAQQMVLGMGCFWGAERQFWSQPGVVVTAVGYAGGITPNPTYEEVCSGRTGHNEVVLVLYEAEKITFDVLLQVFWESHDPTQGMRQGHDAGTQYRSGLYLPEDLIDAAKASRDAYQEKLTARGYGQITTEILRQPEFYFAEDYHQQYLAKHPDGYCGLGGTGVQYR